MSDQRAEVQDALFDWIDAVLKENGFPCEVVWDDTGGVRPKPPFVSLQMIGGSRSSFPWKSRVDPNTGERKARFDMRKTVSIHCWGERCMERLDEIADSISSDKYRRMLRKRGLVVAAITDAVLSAEDRANGTESHGYFDIAVTYIRVVSEEVGWIERVAIKSNLIADTEISLGNRKEEQNG